MKSGLKRLCLGTALAAVGLYGEVAHAQQQMSSQQGFQTLGSDQSLGVAFIPNRTVRPDGGVKLSETSILHVGLGAEAGYDTNVFYQNTNTVSAPVLRLVPFIELTNGQRGGERPTSVYYDLSASLLYREFLTDDERAKAQRAFNPLINGLLDINPYSPVNFTISDQFARLEEPPYGASTGNITRMYNLGSIQMKYAPGGGRLTVMLRYSNMLNVFDNESLKYANHMGHDGTLDISWRWLPKTSVFVQVSQGYIDYFNPEQAPASSPRFNSYPLRTMAGMRGLVTNKLTLFLGAGYQNAFISGGPDSSGLGNLGGLAELTYAPTVLSKIVVGYRHEFRNSPVIGNFYDVDSPYVSLSLNLASRMVLTGFGRYEFRRYRGTSNSVLGTERKDHVIQAGLQADMFVANWFFIGASYIATINDSNYQELVGPGAAGFDYTKHLVLGRLGVTF